MFFAPFDIIRCNDKNAIVIIFTHMFNGIVIIFVFDRFQIMLFQHEFGMVCFSDMDSDIINFFGIYFSFSCHSQ